MIDCSTCLVARDINYCGDTITLGTLTGDASSAGSATVTVTDAATGRVVQVDAEDGILPQVRIPMPALQPGHAYRFSVDAIDYGFLGSDTFIVEGDATAQTCVLALAVKVFDETGAVVSGGNQYLSA